MHADLVKCHNSRCAPIRRIRDNAAATRPQPNILRTPLRLALAAEYAVTTDALARPYA